LSAPNALHDIGTLGARAPTALERDRSSSRALHLFALERGFADALIDRLVVDPFRWITGRLDRLDRLLSGGRR
jgi:hypothetical protein